VASLWPPFLCVLCALCVKKTVSRREDKSKNIDARKICAVGDRPYLLMSANGHYARMSEIGDMCRENGAGL